MKPHLIKSLLVPALIAALGFMPAGRATAQTAVSVNFDGANPNAALIQSGTILYGTSAAGGSWGKGTIFAISTNGSTGLTILHEFSGGWDGASPWDGLILWGNTLYGTAYSGGSLSRGTVFAVNTDGTGFTTLHTFTGGSGGAYPIGGLVLSGNILHGTTRIGGSSGLGTVFSLSLARPAAQSRPVTVSVDANCTAIASIDDGSLPPEGDTLTMVQTPPGPYPLGDTSVTLTVTDSHGASDSCTAIVTVVDTMPPVITCPANIISDATSPAGTVVNFAPTASDNCTLASVTSNPGSGTTFPIGDTTVSCRATDAAGNQATGTFTVHVKGAAEQIDDLIALLSGLGTQSGTVQSLTVKLQGAARALGRANVTVAYNHLGAFLNEVSAQSGKKLAPAQAGLLSAEATRIRAVLNGT